MARANDLFGPRRPTAVLVVVIALASGPVHGGPAEGKALAEALFQEGRQLLSAERVGEACAKFAESERLDPQLGTLLNVASCHEREGKTASAWAEFTQAAARATRLAQAERTRFAREHAQALEQRLSRLRLIREGACAGETIRLDGLALGEAALETALPIDPGGHLLEAEAPGRRPWRLTVQVAAGPSELSVHVPTLAPESPPPSPPPETTAPKLQASPVARPMETRPSSLRRVAAAAGLGLGVAGLAAGSYFGARAFATKSDAGKECDGPVCSPRGLQLYQDARHFARLSDVAFAAALVGLVTGGYLWFRGHGRAGTSGSVALGTAGSGAGLSAAWRSSW